MLPTVIDARVPVLLGLAAAPRGWSGTDCLLPVVGDHRTGTSPPEPSSSPWRSPGRSG